MEPTIEDVKPTEVAPSPTQAPPSEVSKPTLQSVIKDAYTKALAVEKQAEESAEKTLAEDKEPQEPKPEPETKVEAKTEPTTEPKKEEDPKGPIPYDRFQEVVAQKNQFEKAYQEREEYAQAYIKIHNHLVSNNVSQERFAQVSEAMALEGRDPEAALAILRPWVQALETSTGNRLPPDLQSEVDNGNLKLEHAQRIAKAEGQRNIAQRQQQDNAIRTQKWREQELAQQWHRDIQAWDQNKQDKDPAYKPSKNGKVGTYELVWDRIGTLSKGLQTPSIEALLKLAEEAYTSITGFKAELVPLPKPNGSHPVVRASQSIPPVQTPPKNWKEAAESMLKTKYGLSTKLS